MNLGAIEKETGYETARALRELAERIAQLEERMAKVINDTRA